MTPPMAFVIPLRRFVFCEAQLPKLFGKTWPGFFSRNLPDIGRQSMRQQGRPVPDRLALLNQPLMQHRPPVATLPGTGQLVPRPVHNIAGDGACPAGTSPILSLIHI